MLCLFTSDNIIITILLLECYRIKRVNYQYEHDDRKNINLGKFQAYL